MMGIDLGLLACLLPHGLFLLYIGLAYVVQFLRNRKTARLDISEPLPDSVRFATMLQEAWTREHKQIQFEPRPAYYFADPANADERYLGVLGIADDDLVFKSMPDRYCEIKLPLAAIHAMEMVNSHIYLYQEPRVYGFHLLSTYDLVRIMQGHVPNVTGRIGGELSPIKTQMLTQDIYGRWDEGMLTTIYLAPDQLLLNWMSCVHYAQIRSLTVITGESDKNLLRIDYDSGEGEPKVIGLTFGDASKAEAWGAALHQLTDVPYEHIEGRKKKSAKEDDV